MQFKTRHLLMFTAIVGVFLSIAVAIRSAVETRMVVKIDHTNGTRLRVVQEFEYSGELFNTSIYFDDGDGKWRWYYYDHDDWYWGHADANIDGSLITVVANKRSIQFDTETGVCTVSNLDGFVRSYKKSNEFRTLPPGLPSD